MSRKYKFNNKEGIYFVSFATVYWIDVFIRESYFELMIQALSFFRKERGMLIYGYCIMPSHVHLLFQAKKENPSTLIRDLKKFTATNLVNLIRDNQQEAVKNGCCGCSKGQEQKAPMSLTTNSGNTITNPSKFIPINFSTKS